MSTHRFLPNNHDHDDLPPRRGADATDADALDALLNEIAQEPGQDTRPAPQASPRPNVRTEGTAPTGERGDLLHAARAFHRRVEQAEARDPAAAALDPALWEQIMATTASPESPRVPIHSFRTGGPSRRESTRKEASPLASAVDSRRDVSALSRNSPPAPIWRGLANSSLALVIVLAGLATWLVYDRIDGSGPDDPPATMPGLAMVPGTPEATEPAVIPASTPTPAYACDFSRDIPIFQQVDDSPVDGTALVLTTSGELMLTCPEEPEPIVLASGVNAGQVGPSGYPGIVTYSNPPTDDAPAEVTYLNIHTGKSLQSGVRESAMQYEAHQAGSPWLVAPDIDRPERWLITDLRIMESRSFNAYADPESLSGGTIVPPGTPLITAAAGDTLVIGIMTSNDIDREGALFDVEGLPGTLLVLDGSFDNAHWIDVPGDLANIRSMALSPDGQHLALMSNSEAQVSPDNLVTYTILRTSDGAELGRSDGIAFQDSVPSMRWIQDGRAIAYTDNESLMVLAAEAGAQPETVLESDALLTELGTTYDPDVVLVTRQQAEEVATETPDLVRPLTYSVNTATGEAIEIEGADVSHKLSPWEPDTHFLVMGDTYVQWMDAETATFRVVDAVTGETIDEIAGVQISQGPGGPSMSWRSVVSTTDGHTEVVGFAVSRIFLMRAGSDATDIRMLPAPAGLEDATGGMTELWLSDDGSQLSLTIEGDETRTRYLIDLTDPEATWLAVPSTVPGSSPAQIFFVPGTGS